MTTWNTLLEQQALTNALNTPTDSIIPLNDLGVLSVQGHDAQSFLQNLVSVTPRGDCLLYSSLFEHIQITN
jgi:hypothetical protein